VGQLRLLGLLSLEVLLRLLDLWHPLGQLLQLGQARLRLHLVGLLGLLLQLGLLNLLDQALLKLRLSRPLGLSLQCRLLDQSHQSRLECLAHLECLADQSLL
jgi:hypothetical protein